MTEFWASITTATARDTIAVGILCNTSCALVGCYLVLRRMSLLGDAMSHSVLPGIALAFVLTGSISGWPIIVGAMALGVLTSFLTQAIHRYGNVYEDSSMGVVFTSLFALGVIIISRAAAQVDLDAGCVLYGLIEFVTLDTINVLGVEIPRAVITLGGTLLATVLFITLLWKELKIVSFDASLASAMGINATLVHYSLMAMVAGVTVASFEVVGSILVVAMLIVPAAAAHMLTDRMPAMLAWAVAIAIIASVGGTVFAISLETSVSGMMAVVVGVEFSLAVCFAPRHGLLSKWLRNRGLALRIACEDVVGLLYRAEEAMRRGEVARAAISPAIARRLAGGLVGRLVPARLRHQGLVNNTDDGRIQLAEPGRQLARSVVRSHRLWESFLQQHFDLPLDHMHEPAERMEHFIGPELQSELASDLREPVFDPHGRAIPGDEDTRE